MNAEDELAIRNLIARVAWLTDTWVDPQDYVDQYTEDCTWQVEGQQVYHGHEGIYSRMHEMLEQKICGPGIPSRHCVTSLEVVPDPDHDDVATTRAIGLMMSMAPDGRAFPSIYGENVNQVVKTEAGWKIRRRLIRSLAWEMEPSP